MVRYTTLFILYERGCQTNSTVHNNVPGRTRIEIKDNTRCARTRCKLARTTIPELCLNPSSGMYQFLFVVFQRTVSLVVKFVSTAAFVRRKKSYGFPFEQSRVRNSKFPRNVQDRFETSFVLLAKYYKPTKYLPLFLSICFREKYQATISRITRVQSTRELEEVGTANRKIFTTP